MLLSHNTDWVCIQNYIDIYLLDSCGVQGVMLGMGKDKKNKNHGAKKVLGSISPNSTRWPQKLKLREINSLHHLVARNRNPLSQPK